MQYLSLFSGIGGLESPKSSPQLLCDISPACREVLRLRFPGTPVWDDIRTLQPPPARVVAGGFPCQDISTGGKQAGFSGSRSSLFFEMIRVARAAAAHTIVAENVPNLLDMQGGAVMHTVLETLSQHGFRFISWRLLNARQFGLPQQRNRVFLIGSQDLDVAKSIHRPIQSALADSSEGQADGFYWTAGIQSICYSRGYAPTLKVGSSLSIPSPPAVFFDGVVRKLTASECLRLQGFDPSEFASVSEKDVLLMTGNAVPVPAGHFVMEGVSSPQQQLTLAESPLFGWGRFPRDGLMVDGVLSEISHLSQPLSESLWSVVDKGNRVQLSVRAASGLLRRLERSCKDCPPTLLDALQAIAAGPAQAA